MAGRSVAVIGDVIASPGKKMFQDAASGVWTADPVSYNAYNHLAVGGKAVIHGASCTFRFTGTRADGSPVTGDETVDLPAGPTVLQGAMSGVLRNTDKATGKFENQLEVKTANVLNSN